MAPDRPASLPAHVRLIDVVGTGGSGTVWRARDRLAGRDVAVKVIDLPGGRSSGDPASIGRADRFEREARALARLGDHPGILTVRMVGIDDDGRAWLVTDLLSGGSLATRVFGSGAPSPLSADQAVQVGTQVAGALAHAHALDVVHGDVTPANVLLADDGDVAGDADGDSTGSAVLADFGLAVVPDPGDAGSKAADGALTPAYAAPERRAGAGPSPADDVHGLGATLWAAVTGAVPGPRSGPTADPLGRDLPRGLADVLVACCSPTASGRPTAAEAERLLIEERRRRSRTRRR